MATIDLVKKLIEAGFSEAEALVYQRLLPQSAMTIQELTDATGLPRSSVVVALEKLVRTDVVNEYVYGKRRNFVIQSPEDVKKYVNEAEAKISAQKAGLTSLISSIKEQHFLRAAAGINVEILKGAEGFKELYERTLRLKKGEEILRLGVEAQKFIFLPDFLKTYRLRKNKQGIRTRLLIPDNEMGREVRHNDKEDLRETRLLSKNIYNPDTAVAIWGDSAALTIWNDTLETIVITSQPLVDILRSMFELLWTNAKK